MFRVSKEQDKLMLPINEPNHPLFLTCGSIQKERLRLYDVSTILLSILYINYLSHEQNESFNFSFRLTMLLMTVQNCIIDTVAKNIQMKNSAASAHAGNYKNLCHL